jgi:hypothetical protein
MFATRPCCSGGPCQTPAGQFVNLPSNTSRPLLCICKVHGHECLIVSKQRTQAGMHSPLGVPGELAGRSWSSIALRYDVACTWGFRIRPNPLLYLSGLPPDRHLLLTATTNQPTYQAISLACTNVMLFNISSSTYNPCPAHVSAHLSALHIPHQYQCIPNTHCLQVSTEIELHPAPNLPCTPTCMHA